VTHYKIMGSKGALRHKKKSKSKGGGRGVKELGAQKSTKQKPKKTHVKHVKMRTHKGGKRVTI